MCFFLRPMVPTKFNPTSMMQQLLRIMLKDEPSLVLQTPTNNKQIELATTLIPTGKMAFKQFFKVSTPWSEQQNSLHVCIRCHMLSNHTLGRIKFHSPENHLLAWLKKAKVFVESDSLGTKHPVTVGYFTKLTPHLTHLANFQEHLVNQLMLITSMPIQLSNSLHISRLCNLMQCPMAMTMSWSFCHLNLTRCGWVMAMPHHKLLQKLLE